ncbi:MAG: carbohydrate binding domain-containing protein [Oscillospiraceae bacterium]|nr:carbohydrate binding domain-containing protein [Oscillospiraceae bacterium]
MKRIGQIMFASLMSGIMLFQTAAMMPVSTTSAAGACTVNTNKTYQSIRGFGGMNLPEWQGYDLTDAQIQTVFGNGDGQLGLTVLRIFVSDDQSAWSRAVPTAKGAQKLGATVFATPWNPPASMRTNGSGGRTGGKYVLKSGSEAAYAQHLNSYIKYMEGQGINLYSVSVQNEPDCSSDWTHWKPAATASFIANYGKAVKQGTKAKLMSAESFQYGNESTGYGKNYYKAVIQNQQAMENCDLFGTHFYGTQRSQMDYPTVENSGKEIWMTEVYVPNSDTNSANRFPEAISVAENIHNGLVVGNMSAYVWWYIRRSYSLIGQDDGKPTKRGYMMAQYSKYVRPGDVRIDATEQPNNNVLCSAYKHSDKQIEIVAVNKGTSEVSQQFTVSGRNITNVDRYRTTGSENLAETKNLTAQGSSFSAQLPGNSVSTFVVTMDSDGVAVPENPNEPVVVEPLKPDANGYYFHDTFENGTDEWEGRGSAAVAKGGTAYQGSGALSISGREKAWHGAQKTLQYATFEGGKEYSFSANVYSAAAQKVMLSLQYTDAAGEKKYDHIAQAVSEGGYVQLANPNYRIPDGASDPMLYIETEDGTGDLFLDEVIGAVAGTKIEGAKAALRKGDVNGDGKTDAADADTLLKYLLTREGTVSEGADLNGDRIITAADLTLLKQTLTAPAPAQTTAPPVQTTVTTATTAQVSQTPAFNYNANLQYKAAPDSYFKQPANHGKVTEVKYSGINGNKTMLVYTPYGYSESKQYNVFYLMHGGGENEKTCFNDEKINIDVMLDNMIAKGDIEPMIVVTPTFNGCPSSDGNMGAGTVWNEMRQSIIPYVESHYSTYAKSTSIEDLKASRYHRAYGGFSMGGGSTWNMLINNLDICAYYMPLSGHCWGGASAITNAIDKSGFAKNEYFVLAATGTEDVAYNNMVPLINTLKGDQKHFTYTSDFSKGNFYFLAANGNVHYWPQVRHYIYDALPYFFHEGK